MLDNDDSNFFTLIALGSGGWIFWPLVFIAIAVAVTVAQNEDECTERKCATGEPVLVEGECRCLERAQQ